MMPRREGMWFIKYPQGPKTWLVKHIETFRKLFLIVTVGWAINFYFKLKDVLQIYLAGAQAGQDSISLFAEDHVYICELLELLPQLPEWNYYCWNWNLVQ